VPFCGVLDKIERIFIAGGTESARLPVQGERKQVEVDLRKAFDLVDICLKSFPQPYIPHIVDAISR